MLMHGDPTSEALRGGPPPQQDRCFIGRAFSFQPTCNSLSPSHTFGVMWGSRSLLVLSWMPRPACSFLPPFSRPGLAPALDVHDLLL